MWAVLQSNGGPIVSWDVAIADREYTMAIPFETAGFGHSPVDHSSQFFSSSQARRELETRGLAPCATS